MKRNTYAAAVLLATTSLYFSSPALADDAQVKALEQKLEQAMKLIEAQNAQMEGVKSELAQVQKKTSAPQASRFVDLAPAAGGNGGKALEKRIAAIEETVDSLDEKMGSGSVVNAFDAKKIKIGGFFHTTYTHNDGKDGDASAWDRQNFELLIRADLDEDWSAFFAGGFLRQGDASFADRRNPNYTTFNNENPQIIGWVNYKYNDALNIQLGRMITPHGIVNIQHFPATLLDAEQPQFLRPFSGDTIFPNFSTGIQAHGKFYLASDTLSYNTYFTSDQASPEKKLVGGRVAYANAATGITLGLNGMTGARDEAVSSDYTMYGADLRVDKGPFLWESEIYQTDEDAGGDRFTWYTQPAWRITDKWIAFYRYDFLDNGGTSGDTTENVVGINYLPKPTVRLRATATRRDFDQGLAASEVNTEANIFQVSSTFSF
ncbi:MAG: hypothetical protein SFW64_02630 [Alphaproteobacteria bacterium]|nr:hypothetical protein [Alphaproteobacteria bacterium]